MHLFALLVEFAIKPGAMAEFRPLMLENAALSLRDEPGCRQFDVLTAPDDADRIVLYEIYDDQAAFDAHMASAHFRRFAAATTEMIASRSLRRLALVGPDANAGGRNRR
jgi:quinol monooxygenase YgiN